MTNTPKPRRRPTAPKPPAASPSIAELKSEVFDFMREIERKSLEIEQLRGQCRELSMVIETMERDEAARKVIAQATPPDS